MTPHDPYVGADDTQPVILTDELRHALTLLHGGHDLFLTGKAGTGKSTLVRHFLDETQHATLVAAPTGIAALNVGGYTIHRLFGFRPGHTIDHVRSTEYRPGRFAGALSRVRTLVLDEVSMIRADVFDMIAVALERFGPDPTLPFGGVQLVLVGDLYQLPPVVSTSDRAWFDGQYDTPYFFSAHHFSPDYFPTVDLTHVFRQSGDPELTRILNSLREGVLVGHARERLNERTDPDFTPPDDEFWLTLTTTNRRAAAHNNRRLDRLPGAVLSLEASVTGEFAEFEPPTSEMLRIKVGAQIMMLTNDPHNRWVNGTIGRVLDATHEHRDGLRERGPVVVVGFTGGEVVEVEPHTWDITRPFASDDAVRHEVIGTYTQFPFALAWAITIHKSQGQTLDRLVVDLSGGTFAAGQLYVALSRCRSLAGLVLTRPVTARDLVTDRRITRFLRSADLDGRARRYCAIAVLAVGDESTRSRPRPVELAVAFADGTAVSTLINPQRDLAAARSDYGISAADVVLAPTLLEAWTILAPLLDGHTPVGVGVEQTLGQIEHELRRLGSATPLPHGVDIPSPHLIPGERARSRSASALTRARSALAAQSRLWPPDGAAGEFDADLVDDGEIGYLLSRDQGLRTPRNGALPQLSAVVEVSAEVGAALLGLPRGQGSSPPVEITAGDQELHVGARALVAEQLRSAAARVPLTDAVLARLEAAGDLLGADLTRGLLPTAHAEARAVLTSGARVCFTGSALDDRGEVLSRQDIEAVAARHGLVAVSTVTRSRCDVLVVAEPGTQSTKARNALKWEKPILTVADFLDWARGRDSDGV